MFDKEAEEYAEDMAKYYESAHGSVPSQFEKYLRKAVEYGYNKANEWHYVKYGDLPKDDKQYLVLFFYNYKGKKEMSFGVRDNLHSDFEIHRCYTEQIVAWKEIELPKESE